MLATCAGEGWIMSEAQIKISISPESAFVLWGVIDGALDAGACEGGLEPYEREALLSVTEKLLKKHDLWKSASPKSGGGA